VIEGSALGTGTAQGAEARFRQELELQHPDPRVLELGTLRWEANRPTHHAAWRPDAEWVKSDIEAGTDVDLVADAHDLDTVMSASVDAYVAISVYEHLQRPWIAAKTAARVLRRGGLLLVITHQTFPIHGYPHDYFRFSDAALAGIFADAGLEVVEAGYQYPCRIEPPGEVTRWNNAAESWLNVGVFARKP
jgi:SAM-dependent methyltransferase